LVGGALAPLLGRQSGTGVPHSKGPWTAPGPGLWVGGAGPLWGTKGAPGCCIPKGPGPGGPGHGQASRNPGVLSRWASPPPVPTFVRTSSTVGYASKRGLESPSKNRGGILGTTSPPRVRWSRWRMSAWVGIRCPTSDHRIH